MQTLTTNPAVVADFQPAAWVPPSPYHLTAEQIEFFDENGYLVLRNWIPAELLQRVQNAGARWIENALQAGQDDAHRADYAWAKREGGKVLFRINYLHNKGEAASLELLGSPCVLGVAESLCGPNFVPTYESMVFKMPGDGEKIAWHQDACHPRKYRVFNYDLYLDPSHAGAGALRVIPKTQKQKQDICRLAEDYGWEPPGAIEVQMEPGDVLLHDTMVVHGSPRVQGKGLRRTVYLEFRAAEEVIEEGPWDHAWVERRLRLMPLALASHRRAFPDATSFGWNIADEFYPQHEAQESELKVAHRDSFYKFESAGSFCSAGDAGFAQKVAASETR